MDPSSVSELRVKALKGDAAAQFSLACCLLDGKSVSKDEKWGVEWLKKAAAKGNADAQFRMGACLWHGIGVPKDTAAAVGFWQKAADQKNAPAQQSLGVHFFAAGDEKQANIWTRKAAEAGFPLAQLTYAWNLLNGFGVARDEKAAVEWYRKASTDKLAQFMIGVCLHDGVGVAKDAAVSKEWYLKSALKLFEPARLALLQSHAAGLFKFAEMVERGQDIQPDQRAAILWYERAAAAGSDEAKACVVRLVCADGRCLFVSCVVSAEHG